jgi:hypothetical protein
MLLLSQTLTSLEKQRVLDQAVTAGDIYHLDKSSPTGLSHRRRRRRRRKKKEERQRHWIARREPQFLIPTGDQEVPRYDPKWDPENGLVTILSTAFLKD